LGGKIGYDFIGPRIEVEGLYRQNQTGQFFGNRAINGQISQVSAMANFLYDFNATGTIVPYIGAGAGVGFVDSDFNLGSTTFAFQGILGLATTGAPTFDSISRPLLGTTNRVLPARPGRTTTPACSPASS